MSQFIEMYYNTHNKQTLESVCPIMNKGITPKYVESSSVLVINQACIHWDGQRLGNIKYHNEEIPVRKRILESGDVLLNATGNGTLGRCCVFICPSDNNTYINDGHVIALSTDRAVILPEVLNTYLSLNDTQAEIYRQYVTGSTNQVDIVFSDIKKMKVPVPSMDEQILFVEVLTQADKSKFGDFKSQFVEMFGNTPMSYEMQDCFSLIRNGANIKQGQFEGGIPITRIETISDEIVDRQKMGYAGIADNKYELYYLQDGDILISHINSLKHIGKCALYNKKENESIIHGMNLLCLRPNIVTINPVFAIHMLRSNIIRKGITDITKPAVNQASFSAKDFGKLRTIIPPMDKQMLFVSIAEQADKSKSVIQKALVYLNDIQSDELGKIA